MFRRARGTNINFWRRRGAFSLVNARRFKCGSETRWVKCERDKVVRVIGSDWFLFCAILEERRPVVFLYGFAYVRRPGGVFLVASLGRALPPFLL